MFLTAMTVPHDRGIPLGPLFNMISNGFTYSLRLIRVGLSCPDP